MEVEDPSACSSEPVMATERHRERRIVKEWHVKSDLADRTELIRSIQRSEGNPDCFRKKRTCEEIDCAWRSYCLPPLDAGALQSNPPINLHPEPAKA